MYAFVMLFLPVGWDGRVIRHLLVFCVREASLYANIEAVFAHKNSCLLLELSDAQDLVSTLLFLGSGHLWKL